MPESVEKEFKKINKFCEFCGKKLILICTRDIKRKRFCSRKCQTYWLHKYGSLKDRKVYWTAEAKEKMRQTILEQYRNGRVSVGWKKYKTKERISGRGYIFIGHKRKHQELMEKKLGRRLKKGEVVHHIDGDKLNNNLDNLVVMSRSEHMKLHTNLRKEQYVTVSS